MGVAGAVVAAAVGGVAGVEAAGAGGVAGGGGGEGGGGGGGGGGGEGGHAVGTRSGTRSGTTARRRGAADGQPGHQGRERHQRPCFAQNEILARTAASLGTWRVRGLHTVIKPSACGQHRLAPVSTRSAHGQHALASTCGGSSMGRSCGNRPGQWNMYLAKTRGNAACR